MISSDLIERYLSKLKRIILYFPSTGPVSLVVVIVAAADVSVLVIFVFLLLLLLFSVFSISS